MKVEGNKLTLVIDLDEEGTPSGSGKTLIVASTSGNASIPGTNCKIGLNVFKPNPDAPKG